MSNWNNKTLEPVIITYNRAAQLEKTLAAFFAAGLTDMRLHVLDNASTDETARVVKHYQAQWPNLQYHCNRFNVSGNGNILRSIEIAQSDYHWVIGDDDEWLFTPENLANLMNIANHNQADIIRLGWLVSPTSRGISHKAIDLAMTEPLFFASLSMISSNIIKRSLIVKYLPLAYQSTCDSYPQLVAPIRGTEDMPLKVYTLTEDLMTHTPSQTPGYFAGDLEWYAGWFRMGRFFTSRELKKRFINEITYYMCRHRPGKIPQFFWLVKVMFYYKSFGLNQWPYLLSMLGYGEGWRINIVLLMILNGLVPSRLLALARKTYFKLRHLPQKTINIDRSRL